jgi:hypothetical protein
LDSFSYLSVLLSIVIGLAITQTLQGLRSVMLSRGSARLYGPSLIWAALMLLMATQMWWSSFGLRDHEGWTFGTYGLVLLQVSLFYLASGLVLPDLTSDRIDLEEEYYGNRAWFFGLLAATAVASLLKDLALKGSLPGGANLLFHLVLIGSSATAIATANRLYHRLLAPTSLVLFTGYIALLFARL